MTGLHHKVHDEAHRRRCAGEVSERVTQPRVPAVTRILNESVLMPQNLPHSLFLAIRQETSMRAVFASNLGLRLGRRLFGAGIERHSTTSTSC